MFLVSFIVVSLRSCFPRIRGDVPGGPAGGHTSGTFSPHTRGCSEWNNASYEHWWVFPAYAGMFRGFADDEGAGAGFPRIRGDVPFAEGGITGRDLFSPRMRGCSRIFHNPSPHYPVFPAYAGMFLNAQFGVEIRPGFPRIRGDVPVSTPVLDWRRRFSPHTRGYSRGKACNEEDSSEKI